MSDENVIFMDFFDVKLDGSDVIAGISLHVYENLFTDCRCDITSVNFNSEKVHEDDIFVRQDILHTIFLRRIQILQIFKIPIDVIRTFRKHIYK